MCILCVIFCVCGVFYFLSKVIIIISGMVVLRMERLILSLEKLVVCIIINLELEVNVFKLISVFNRVVIGKNIFIL